MDKPDLSVDDQLTSSMDPASDSASSSVVTLEPYAGYKINKSLPLPQRKGRNNLSVNTTGNNITGKREILPGVFEPVCYSKFLTLALGDDRKFSSTDLFQVNRDIIKCIGRQPKISRVGDGELLVEVSSPEESEKLQKLTKVNGCKTNCAPHKLLNQCKGVIYCRDLVDYSEEKLLSEFESQNVVAVQRIKKRENGELCPTPLLVLTFKQITLPATISAAWFNLKVKPFVPSPKRCYYCQMYGHVYTSCRKRLKGEPGICVRCGGDQHENCEKTPSCFHCKGNHMASSKACERYIFEKEVLTLKTKERITFREAKERVQQRYGPRVNTFSSVVRNSNHNGNKEIRVPHSSGSDLSENKKLSSSSKPSQAESMEITMINKRTRSQDSLELPSKLTKSNVVSQSTSQMGSGGGPSTLSGGHVKDSLGSARGLTAGPLASSGGPLDNTLAPLKIPNSLDSSPPETSVSDTQTVSKESASGCPDRSGESLPPSLPDIESGNYKELGALPKAPKDKKNSPHPIKPNGKPKGGASRKTLNRESPSIKRK